MAEELDAAPRRLRAQAMHLMGRFAAEGLVTGRLDTGRDVGPEGKADSS